jgi:hypothetical protein
VVFADSHETGEGDDVPAPGGGGDGEDNPVPGGGGDGSVCSKGKLCNPLNTETVNEFIVKVIEVLIVFAVPIIVLFIMYSGFLFVTARGDVEQIKTARRALLWSVLGGVIALGAKLIIEVIQGTITAF